MTETPETRETPETPGTQQPPAPPGTSVDTSGRVFVRPSKPIAGMSDDELDALVREIWRTTGT